MSKTVHDCIQLAWSKKVELLCEYLMSDKPLTHDDRCDIAELIWNRIGRRQRARATGEVSRAEYMAAFYVSPENSSG
jgi:hypothetical protein